MEGSLQLAARALRRSGRLGLISRATRRVRLRWNTKLLDPLIAEDLARQLLDIRRVAVFPCELPEDSRPQFKAQVSRELTVLRHRFDGLEKGRIGIPAMEARKELGTTACQIR